MTTLKPALLLSVCILTACGGGGGGGGGGGDKTPPTTTPPVQTDNGSGNNAGNNNTGTTPQPPASAPTSLATGGTLSGYTYTTPQGLSYTMRGTGIEPAYVFTQSLTSTDGTRHSATSWCCGRMSYTTFGTWTDFKTGKHDVFYTGEPTLAANVPTQGTATYVGNGMREDIRSDATFNVDFAAKTINGNIAAGDAFGSAVAMQGTIADGGFTGKAQSGGQDGTFTGHFNGPAAQELGGLASFADTSKNVAFGATRQ
ncbi:MULTISPECIES: Slam-dependent surface lipoprotein [unclassified Enterobacter]|uniref:Slam-dependent surface lipoprotein n=1 Tax=unclassified Enterobacter TaxID=2608935 RepID=UPI00296E6AE7|nr:MULTISPECIES: Slam-dependent surface lipoprotein [unclassified Enterobacter]WJD50131.1 Slam-dependent surface lipoprotein [Enterobacter sp. PGRG2]